MAAEAAGADAVTVINTIPALVVDSRERKVFLRGDSRGRDKAGGLAGGIRSLAGGGGTRDRVGG